MKKRLQQTGIEIFDQVLERYYDHMSIEGKASAKIQNYLRAPKELMLHFNKLPEDCSVEQIKSFMISQRDTLDRVL